MQNAVQIDFQGMEPRESLRAVIFEHIAGLEDRFGRITAGRVLLKAPGQHHRSGGLYEVHIKLALPDGREVDVAHTPQNDERYTDVHYALNNAFKRARRQLQDQVRRLQGHVKARDAQPAGTVTQLRDDFGFLETDDGREIYFHRNSVLDEGFAHLRVGTRVSFSEEMGERGPQASTVHLLGKHGLR